MQIDLSKILPRNSKEWVALTPDNKKLVARGKTLQKVLEESEKKGVSNPSVLKLAPFRNSLIG